MYISNLAKYINIFNSCTINVFNYQNIDIPQTAVPIWTTRFTTVDFCPDVGYLSGWTLFYTIFLLDPVPGEQNTTIPNCTDNEGKDPDPPPFRKNSGQQKAWTCLTRFYIFPPQKNLGILHPSNYEEEFANRPWYSLFGTFELQESRVGYHMFVQNKGTKISFSGIATFYNGVGLTHFPPSG